MGVLGDSIAAGTLADLPLSQAADYSARLVYTNKTHLSWASGDRIRSHFELLSEHLKAGGSSSGLEVVNFSRPGSEASDLPGQARRLVRAFKAGGFGSLKYVAISIGSNDACDGGVLPIRIRAALVQMLEILREGIRQSEPLRILVLGPPMIPDLGRREFRVLQTILGLRCGLLRDGLLRFCNGLTVWRGEREYAERVARVVTIDETLRSALSDPPEAVEVRYSSRLQQLEVSPADLAIDCFHPSSRGQERIALATWGEQPWFH
jgi:lysophospholipase L1-like esterase